MEEQLQRDALEYHRDSNVWKDFRHSHQEPDQPARSRARLFAWRRLCVPGDQRRSRTKRPL